MNNMRKMDLTREAAILHDTVDRFFGTMGGQTYTEEILLDAEGNIRKFPNGKEMRVKKMVPDEPNVFAELSRLTVCLCGGAIGSTITDQTVNDLDFYVQDATKTDEAVEFLKKYFPLHAFASVNAVTLQRKSVRSAKKWSVQLILKFTGSPAEIFDWFDFTITHGAYVFNGREINGSNFVFGDRFFTDIAARRLVYSGSSMYPICAMYRTKKYQERGYTVSGSTIMHIALSIVQLDIQTYAQLKEQLMGIDTMYLQRLLDEQNPNNPVDFGDFIEQAFKRLDHLAGKTVAEMDE